MTVPIYIHVPVVLALLALHGSTAYWALRKIRELQGALVAKKVLLGAGANGYFMRGQRLEAGETVTLRDDKNNLLEITSREATHLDVKVIAA